MLLVCDPFRIMTAPHRYDGRAREEARAASAPRRRMRAEVAFRIGENGQTAEICHLGELVFELSLLRCTIKDLYISERLTPFREADPDFQLLLRIDFGQQIAQVSDRRCGGPANIAEVVRIRN